jgi:methyl-accepting chemotaxis protein
MNFPWITDGQKIFRIILTLQLILSIIIGFSTGELVAAFILGIPIVAVPLFLSIQSPHAEISKQSVAIAVQLMTALHIHQAYGMIELHFEIFVVLALLAYYRDWKMIATSTLVVAIHHISFFLLQESGAPVFIFEKDHSSVFILFVHAAFALAEGIALIIMTRKSHMEGQSGYILETTISNMIADPKRLNLNVKLDTSFPMLHSFDTLLTVIRQLVKDASKLADDVATTTSFIETSTHQLSEHAKVSNQEIASISAAAEEIAVTMHMASERTSEAHSITDEAKLNTQTSRTSVDETKTTIASLRDTLNTAAQTNAELNERCANISEAMRSITSVADQTNLLALNAAIESARAGEHGRGFAVVADEVRNLAIRSKNSADEITAITEQLVASTGASVTQMEECISMVDRAVSASDNASDAMQLIMDKINDASLNMTEVAASAVEQESASSSIAGSTAKIHELSEFEARTAADLEIKTKTLAELCQTMQSTVRRFIV